MNSVLFQINFDIEFHYWWFRSRRQILCDLIHDILPPSKDTTIVEVGCGTGATIGVLSKDYHCIGIDPSPDAVSLARKRFSEVDFRCGPAPQTVRSAAPAASLFLLADVAEHVADDRGMIEELVDMAPPGAYLLATVPADMSLWSSHDEVHGHYRRYDPASFSGLWRGLPVDTMLLSHFNSRLYPLIKTARTLRRWLHGTWGRAQTDLAMPPRLVNTLLERVFLGERRVLRDARDGKCQGYRKGASLVALLQKQAVGVPAGIPLRRAA